MEPALEILEIDWRGFKPPGKRLSMAYFGVLSPDTLNVVNTSGRD